MLVQRHAADLDAFVADLTPKVARQQRHVIGLYLAHLDATGVGELTAAESILAPWLKHPPWTTPTRKLYGGMVRRFVRTVMGGVAHAPEPGLTLPEPVDVPAPVVRARTPEEIAEQRRLREPWTSPPHCTENKKRPATALPEKRAAPSLVATALSDLAEKLGAKLAAKLQQQLDDFAASLAQQPASSPPAKLSLDTPREVIRHQLVALVRALGIRATAELLDVAPSGLAKLEKAGHVPRVPDHVALDTAYVRLRWIQRELAEDDELDDVARRVRAVARAELDERAQEVQ